MKMVPDPIVLTKIQNSLTGEALTFGHFEVHVCKNCFLNLRLVQSS